MKRILTLAVFLGFMLPSFSGFASDLDNKLYIFLAGGQSTPVGDFGEQVKPAFNLGGGFEFRFSPNWGIGTYINKVNFKHKNIWYDDWNMYWTYTDWSFMRVYSWVKYIFIRKSFSPFLKLGVGTYYKEDKRAIIGEIGKSEIKKRDSGISLVPAAGFEYKIKKLLFYIETDYNIIATKHIGGDRAHIQASQFFEILFGVGVSLNLLKISFSRV